MPADGTIQIATQVNVIPIVSGMAEARAAVKQATAEFKEAQRALAAQGVGAEQAGKILAEYAGRVNQAKAAVAALNAEQAKAASFSPPALRWSSATREMTDATRATISEVSAASAAVRTLEGGINGSVRAAERFLTASLGLGPVLQAAFPVFGALALVEILGRMAEKVAKLSQDWGGLQTIADEAFQKMAADEQEAIRISEDHIRATRDFAVAVAELHSGKAGRSAAGAAAGDNFDLAGLKQQLGDVQAQIKATQGEYDRLQETIKNGTLTTHVLAAPGMPAQSVTTKSEQADAAEKILPKVYSELALQQQQAGQIQAEIEAKQTQGLLRQKEVAEDLAATLQRQRAELLSFEQDTRRLIDSEARAEEEAGGKVAPAAREHLSQVSGYTRAVQSMMAEDDRASTQYHKSYEEGQERVAEAQAKMQAIQTEQNATIAEAAIGFQVATGRMSALAAAHQLGAIHAAEYAQKLAELRAELDRINSDPNLTQTQKDEKSAGINNQIAQVSGQRQTTVIQDQTRSAQLAAQPWETAANQISDAWIGAFNKIIVGGRESWHALGQASEQMTMALINDAERWLVKKLETYAIDKIQAVISAHTTQASIATTNVAAAESYAAVAATAAAAAVAGIPVVGPGLALSAASAMESSLQGFAAMAAFDKGTSYIPRDGFAMLHKGEAVLPPPQTEALLSALGGRRSNQSGQARGVQIHYAPVFQSGGTQSDARKAARDLSRMYRNTIGIT